jgi:hypothetical protein
MNGWPSRAPNRGAPAAAPPAAAGRIASAAALLLLAGCAGTGDFGRPRATPWSESVLPAAGTLAAYLREEPTSFFDLTDDEAELRARAWRFLMPAHERAWFDRQLADLVRHRVLPLWMRPNDPRAYHAALTADAVRSPVSRYRRLGDDVAADAALVAPFAARAARVLEMDRARLRAVPFMRDVDEGEIRNAAARVAENRCLVAWVRQALAERIVGYGHALEQLFLETPDRNAVVPERALAALKVEAARLDAFPVPPFAQGGCIGAEAEATSVAVPAPRRRAITK